MAKLKRKKAKVPKARRPKSGRPRRPLRFHVVGAIRWEILEKMAKASGLKIALLKPVELKPSEEDLQRVVFVTDASPPPDPPPGFPGTETGPKRRKRRKRRFSGD
jgi:hypothetical protein